MLLLKISGGIFLLLSGTFTGFYFSYKLKQRITVLNQTVAGIKKAETLVGFSSKNIYEILNICFDDAEFLSISNNKISVDYGAFSDEDRIMFRNFLKDIGTSFSEDEKTKCNGYIKLFENSLFSAQKEYDTKNKIYKISGLCAGLALCILII